MANNTNSKPSSQFLIFYFIHYSMIEKILWYFCVNSFRWEVYNIGMSWFLFLCTWNQGTVKLMVDIWCNIIGWSRWSNCVYQLTSRTLALQNSGYSTKDSYNMYFKGYVWLFLLCVVCKESIIRWITDYTFYSATIMCKKAQQSNKRIRHYTEE